MAFYSKPSKKIHRGFFYLDDETVVNSLSAVEAGKIDEIVAKINSAREGGFGGGVGAYGVKVEANKKTTSEFEEEIVRTRTRFSVFELWYQSLVEAKALGSFDGWGSAALADVSPGETLEFRGHLETAPLQTLLRLYLWFAERAKEQGHIFSQKGEELRSTKEAERVIKMLLGDSTDDDDQVVVLATPNGEAGPKVVLPVKTKWLIGKFGQFGGEYSVVGQVDRILNEGEELPALRLTQDVAATSLEVSAIKDSMAAFKDPANALGFKVTDDDAAIAGPALWLEPIAIFR